MGEFQSTIRVFLLGLFKYDISILTGLQVREAGGVPEGLVPGPEQGGGDLPGPHYQDGGGGRPRLQVTLPNNTMHAY